MVRRVVPAIACLLICVGGCGGSSRPGPSAGPSSAATVRVADCRLWQVLSSASRRRLVVAMREFFGGSVPGHGRGQVLADQQATKLFDSFCARRFAGAFKLYKLYGRAAAFTPAAGVSSGTAR